MWPNHMQVLQNILDPEVSLQSELCKNKEITICGEKYKGVTPSQKPI